MAYQPTTTIRPLTDAEWNKYQTDTANRNAAVTAYGAGGGRTLGPQRPWDQGQQWRTYQLTEAAQPASAINPYTKQIMLFDQPAGGAGGLGTGGLGQLGGYANQLLGGGLSFPMQQQWMPKTNIGNPGSNLEMYPGLSNALSQMFSATPNMDIWGPAMDEATRRLTQVWQEQTLPGIRSEAQAAGQLGGPRNALQLQGAADKFSQNMANTQSLLAAQAAQSAQDQRNLAAQMGLDMTKLQDASRIADIQGLLDQARIYEAGRATNLQTMLSDLSRRESGRQADLNAMVGMRGQDYNYDLGWGGLNLNRDQLQSQQALALLGLQQNAQLGGLGQLGPMLQAQGYPAGLLGQLGNYQYGRDAAYLGDVGRIYGGSVQGPLPALQAYNGLIGNPYGTQTQYSYGPSPLQGAIGGAAAGAGLANYLGGGGMSPIYGGGYPLG